MPRAREKGVVCCIGSMTVDRMLELQGPGSLDTTNPVRCLRVYGGAARNVAHCLARLSIPGRLLSVVGDDHDGRELVLATARQGVDTGLVQKSLSRTTGSFFLVKKLDGAMFAAFADMDICASMDRGFIQNRWIPISQSPFVFADAWLPADSLAWLIAGCREHRLPLLLDAVSTATARHLPLNLNGVELLVCSADEARSMLGDELERDAGEMATALRRRGAKRVVVATESRLACAGAGAALAMDTELPTFRPPLVRAALIAGIVHGRLQRRAWRSSLSSGLEAARIAASADDELSDLSAEAVTKAAAAAL